MNTGGRANDASLIDRVPGRGGMFSLDNGRGERFLTRSRVFTPEELRALDRA